MKEKLVKYLKMTIVIFLAGSLIGIYFLKTGQFENHSQKILLDRLSNNYNRNFAWLSLAIFAIGWVLWEFAIAKSGNKNKAYAAIAFIVVGSTLSLNIINYICTFIALIIIVLLTVMYVPKVQKKLVITDLEDNKKKIQEDNQKLKEAISFKKKEEVVSEQVTYEDGI